jgi:hypothetical protein
MRSCRSSRRQDSKAVRHSVSAVPEVKGLGRALKQWRGPILSWHTTGASDGPAEDRDRLSAVRSLPDQQPVDAAVIPQGVCWGIPAVGSLGDVLVDGGGGCGGGSFFGSVGASVHGDVVGVVDESVEDGFGDDGVWEERIPVFGFAV